tara:strand:- start:22051 stop:22428 length:378 start_codon:yes stop_codon:yes gene_type:complete
MSDIIGQYDFEFVEADTFSGFALRLTTQDDSTSDKEPIDLTGATIQLRISSTAISRKKYVDLTTYNGRISITNATDGRCVVNKQKIKLEAGLYDYSLQVKYGDGDQRTYLNGNCNVLSNTTYSQY